MKPLVRSRDCAAVANRRLCRSECAVRSSRYRAGCVACNFDAVTEQKQIHVPIASAVLRYVLIEAAVVDAVLVAR